MKISIIIPVYNVANYIERCLQSALNQTYQDIECILIDDASPDDSMNIVEEILNTHPKKEAVKIVHHPKNKGLSAARNTGIKASSGDYIFFLDSDDELPVNCIETLVSLTNNQTMDFVIGEIEVIGNKRNVYPPLLIKDGMHFGNNFIRNSYIRKEWYEMAWNKLIKRNLFTENDCLFEEGILHEDTLWSFQLALIAQSMAVTHIPTYYYHIQENSITQKKSLKNIESFYFILDKMIQSANQKQLFNALRETVHYFESQRIYFIKSLLRGNFEKQYRKEQRDKINRLYKASVWSKKKRSIEIWAKDFILSLWMALKN